MNQAVNNEQPNETRFADYVREQAIQAKHQKKGMTFFCARYFFSGEVVEVNRDFIALDGVVVPWEIGELKAKDWASSEKIPNAGGRWNVMVHAIESFGILK